jgi:cytochrome P450
MSEHSEVRPLVDTDVAVPAGSRLAALFGSANSDERQWSDTQRFDIGGNNIGHLAALVIR